MPRQPPFPLYVGLWCGPRTKNKLLTALHGIFRRAQKAYGLPHDSAAQMEKLCQRRRRAEAEAGVRARAPAGRDRPPVDLRAGSEQRARAARRPRPRGARRRVGRGGPGQRVDPLRALAIKTEAPLAVLRDSVAQFPSFTDPYALDRLELSFAQLSMAPQPPEQWNVADRTADAALDMLFPYVAAALGLDP